MDDDHNFVMIRITEIRARRSVLTGKAIGQAISQFELLS